MMRRRNRFTKSMDDFVNGERQGESIASDFGGNLLTADLNCSWSVEEVFPPFFIWNKYILVSDGEGGNGRIDGLINTYGDFPFCALQLMSHTSDTLKLAVASLSCNGLVSVKICFAEFRL